MKTLLFIMLLVVLGACGDGIEEVEMPQATITQFEADAARIAARDDERSPLAVSVLDSNGAGLPVGVQVWNPGKALFTMGVRNGDIVASVDGALPSRDYGSAFAADQKPFSSPTEQYVHFVSGLIARGQAQKSLLLAIHRQYRTRDEREKYGGSHAKDAQRVRVLFP